MLIRLWILEIIISVALSELRGDNICEVEESYPVNVTEYSWRNATVRNYKWCMGFPPRCSFYTFKRVRVPNVVEKNETRIVKKCCTGYAVNSEYDGCVQCKKCHYGTCGDGGKCICNAGFKGDQCDEACGEMLWGIDCQFQCLCERGNCDPRTGRCDCPSGWFGTRCELTCLEGFYGKHCMHRCSCGERELCSSQTGECATKKQSSQEHQSTRAIHYLTDDILNFTRMIDKQKSTPSLKKYYTFDMELSTIEPIYPKITVEITDINKKHRRKPNYSNKSEIDNTKFKDSKTNKPKNSELSTTVKRKNHERNRDFQKMKAKDEYVDSTTEISIEIEHSEENLPILNENQSLEGKDSTELKKEYRSREDSSEIKKSSQLVTKEQVSSVTSKNYMNTSKDAKSKLEIANGKKYIEKGNVKNENQKKTKLELTTLTSNTSQIYTHKGNNAENSITSKISKASTTIIKKNEEKHDARINEDPRPKTLTSTKFTSDSTNKIPPKPERNNYQRKLEPVNPTADPKQPHKYNSDSDPTTTTRSNDFVINFSPTIENTTPIYKTEENYQENVIRNEEEDKLQNLDNIPLLTSTSMSTTVSKDQDISTTKRGKMVLYSDENPTPSIINVHTTPSTEIRTPLEGIPDFRRKKEDDNYLSDEISGEFNYSSTDTGNLVTHVSIAVFTTFILVMIMATVFVVHYYTRRRRKQTSKIRSDHHQSYSGTPTVSVYTHSIFHTPLPDPPTFENPVFVTPTENSIDHRTFQTHLVCSLNFPSHRQLDEKEYTYDHPPSTGSYRAASIPEPPDLNESTTSEPLYDEIPSNIKQHNKTIHQPYKSSCIYVNTCGKTKF